MYAVINPGGPQSRVHAGEPLDVELLDALGRPLASLYSGSLLAGTYRLNQNVPDVAPGMYFLRIMSGKKDTMMKLVITR